MAFDGGFADETADLIRQALCIQRKLGSVEEDIRARFIVKVDNEPENKEQIMHNVIKQLNDAGGIALTEELNNGLKELQELFARAFPEHGAITLTHSTPAEVVLEPNTSASITLPPAPESFIIQSPNVHSPALQAATEKGKRDEEQIAFLRLRIAERKRELEKAALQLELEELNQSSVPSNAKKQSISPQNSADKTSEQLANSEHNGVESNKLETMLLNINAAFNAQAALQAKQNAELIKTLSTFHNATQNIVRKQHEAHNVEYSEGEEEQHQQESEYTRPKPQTFAGLQPDSQPVINHYSIRLDSLLNLMDPFDGSTDYELFRTQFKSMILDNKATDPLQQQLALSNLLKGEALACVRVKSNPIQSVTATLETLDNVYGREHKEHILREKLRELPFHQTDPHKMRLSLASHSSIIERLEESGYPTNDMRTVLEIVGKLPSKMIEKLAEYISHNGNRISVNAVISQITALIEAVATEKIIEAYKPKTALNEIPELYAAINYAARESTRVPQIHSIAPLAYDPSKYEKTYSDPIMNEVLAGYYALGSGPQEKALRRTFPVIVDVGRCSVCDGQHRSIRCSLSSSEFRRRIAQKGKCPICTGPHSITECRNSDLCIYCSGLHHTGGCTMKEFYRDPNNLPEGSRPKKTRSRPSKGTRRH
uniref:Integrase catalytic domain-containing protein n=1 Tax=Caenorhabditis tropicalis TaxID=1561998 RepID=A0A1I7TAL6_9PELO